MTIASQASTTVVLGNGVTTSFVFNFTPDAAEFIQVIFADTDLSQTTLDPTQYTLVLNAISPGQIWSQGGTITYPTVISGNPPIANGTSLTISRILPYTQVISISNQGAFAAEVIEEMGDTLMMQIQQLTARTGQIRGTWVTGASYTYSDIIVDGANGTNTGQFYLCAISNTSGTWTTDLSAGDWVLAFPPVNSQIYTSLTVTGATLFNLGANPFNLITTDGDILIETAGIGNINLSTISGSISLSSAATGNIDGFDIGAITPGNGTFNAFTATNTTTLSAGANIGDDINATVATKGLTLKRGANGRVGTFTLAGTAIITVSNTSISTSDLISFSINHVGGTVGAHPVIKTITPATGFTVNGSSGDLSSYNYGITRSIL